MSISEEEKVKLEEIYQSFLHNEKVKQMINIPLHRGSNCYEHCFKVAKKAIKHANRSFKKNINYRSLLIGAILHDYYLYDWRNEKTRKKRHGRNHPFIASKNSERDFEITDDIKRIIETHMWPINRKEYPKSKEAKIVSICDKMVSVGEVLTSIKFKAKRRKKYQAYIQKLFDK